jgi:hypothetical protein
MLQEIVTGCASLGGPPELDAFRKHLPQERIEEAPRATGTATLRRRRLPAERVVWLVLGMALFKDRSTTDVVNKWVCPLCRWRIRAFEVSIDTQDGR